MAEYTVDVKWDRGNQDFFSNRYSRKHTVRFDGGHEMPSSSSPHVVPVPMSDESAVDPEEMFVSSLSACHMLWFLSIAAKRRFIVDCYKDRPVGIMEKNDKGQLVMSRVTLKPHVVFSGDRRPTREQLNKLHHEAHESCFIANSVLTKINVDPAD